MGVDSGQQHRELVAAQAGQNLPGAAQILAQPIGHRLEQGVPGVVTEAVVDFLEPVQVEQQHGARAGFGGQVQLGVVIEEAPVAQTGEFVGVGQFVTVSQGAGFAERHDEPGQRGDDGGSAQANGDSV